MSIVDVDEGWRLPSREVDVCVVGSGAAGITVAIELAASGHECLLLEGGGRVASRRSQNLYHGSSTGIPYSLESSRLRYLGGSTNHWAGWCRRLDPVDLKPHPRLPHSGWPIRYDDLAVHYPRAETICELGDGGWDAARWLSEMNTLPLPVASDRFTTEVFRFSPPTRFASRYLDVLSAEQIVVALNANAIGLAADTQGTVRGVRVATSKGDEFIVRSRRVVIAMGGVENARFLLNARAELSALHDAEWIGSCFMEHPHFYEALVMISSASALRDFEGYLLPFSGERGHAQLSLDTSAELRSKRDLPRMSATLRDVTSESGVSADDVRSESNLGSRGIRSLMRFGGSAADRLVGFEIRAEQSPSRASRVSLADRTDRFGLHRAVLNWQVDAFDRESVFRSADLLAREFTRIGLGRVHSDFRSDRGWREVLGGNHHMGTTRMSSKPDEGVVDEDCRVHGTSNLYVAGSSVFPTGGAANPTLTIVALAVRLAQHLASSA